MTSPHTRAKLFQDLRDLGIQPGDMLFVHSSFKSLGPVDGGAATVIGSLEDAVGPEGLILMPSFNVVAWEDRPRTWNVETTPSTVGWVTEFFRLMPGTYRSDHHSHSVAARGKGAKEAVSGHLSREGMRSNWDLEPWGRALGTHSPMNKAYRANGKLLMLGVDYGSSTYCHFTEAIYWNKQLERAPDALYPLLKRSDLGEFWDRTGRLSRGRVGDADCRLFQIREYVDTLLSEATLNPEPYWYDYLLVPGSSQRRYVR